MEYALLIYTEEPTEAPPDDVLATEMEAYNAFGQHLRICVKIARVRIADSEFARRVNNTQSRRVKSVPAAHICREQAVRSDRAAARRRPPGGRNHSAARTTDHRHR